MTSMFVIGEIQEKTLNSNIQQTIRQTRQQFEDLSINTDLDSVNILYAKNIPFISLDISIDSTRSRTISRSSTMEQLFTLAQSTLGY
jgi:alcohol dehydrogenase YqhD (iron-dependent ADH family)